MVSSLLKLFGELEKFAKLAEPARKDAKNHILFSRADPWCLELLYISQDCQKLKG